MKKIEQLLLNKILYIGEEIPNSLAQDKRPKFILLGTPQELIDKFSTTKEQKNEVITLVANIDRLTKSILPSIVLEMIEKNIIKILKN